MLMQTEKSSDSRSMSPAAGGKAVAHDEESSGGGKGAAEAALVKKGKVGSKAKQPPRSASVPLAQAASSGLHGPAPAAADAAAPAAAAAASGSDADEGIAFIADGRFEQRPSTSASKSRCYRRPLLRDLALTRCRLGIRDHKQLPPPPSQLQAANMEFGDAAGVLPPLGKRQKTAAGAAIKKPGGRRGKGA